MRTERWLYLSVAVCVAVALAGCSTTPKKKQDEEIKGIKAQVETLSTRVDAVEAKQAETEKTVSTPEEPRYENYVETNFDTKPRSEKAKASIRDIQTCLKNAGYYDGRVDGVKGKQTKRAIRKFQKDNGLTADGVVGKRTWDALSKYLSGGSGDRAK